MKINGTSHPVAGNFALRARCKVARGTSLNVRYGGIVSPYEMENSIQPHYPIRKYPLKIDFHDFERFRAVVVRGTLRRQPYRTRYCG